MNEQEIDDALQHARLDEKLSIARTADTAPDKSSMADAAMRGGAKGITFGLADEAYGVLGGLANPANMPSDPNKSMWSNFKDRYSASRDYAREHDAQAAEEHPVAFHGAELAGTIASPVSKLFAPAEGAGALSAIGKGAGAGALSGFGGSNADNPEGLAADVAGGAALGGALAGGGRLASNFLGKLTPDNLKQTGTGLLAKAAGAKGLELERSAPLLSAADEAGPAVVGFGSKASDIAEAAAQKARYYGEAEAPKFDAPIGSTWRPFGGSGTKVVGGMPLSEEEAVAKQVADTARRAADASNAGKARDYQAIAASAARKAEDQGTNGSDYGLPTAGIMASIMSGHFRPGHIAAMAALGVGKKAVRERGASVLGRAAIGAGNAVEGITNSVNGLSEGAGTAATLAKKLILGTADTAPVEVGTVTGAANQFLASGLGGQAVTEQVMGMAPESAADQREKRLRDIMVKRLRDLSNQGYASPTPRIVPQSP